MTFPGTCFYLKQILHISEVDVRETKMMGTTPIIILMVSLCLDSVSS